ncbi:MAG: DoxX family protein [Gemmatimonadetes bacterium]|nr:DoxX family protein [Gemmatimonadota bacterium]
MERSWSYTPQAAWASLFARGILGLLFFMAGWFKVFTLGPVGHAQRFFIQDFAESWIPLWLLWTLGVSIPFVELAGGALLLVGFQVRRALVGLGFLLLIVTYGHLLLQPLFDITVHILPRAILLLFLLVIPAESHRWSIDGLIRERRGALSK